MFEFKHLPDPGGIYAQHPEVLDAFYYIMVEQQKQEKRERDKKDRAKGGPTATVRNRDQPMDH